MIWIIRSIFLLVMTATAAEVARFLASGFNESERPSATWIIFLGTVLLAGFIVFVDWLYPKKKVSTISSIYFGLIVGLLLGYLFSMVLEPSITTYFSFQTNEDADRFKSAFSMLIYIISCYLSISVLMQTSGNFRFIIPYVEFNTQVKGNRPLILDSNVLIDGRICDMAETGILAQTFVVPRCVMEELQNLSTNSEKSRRARGRRGLDNIDKLQHSNKIELDISDVEDSSSPNLDREKKLIYVANSLNGVIVTGDQNLIKIAHIGDVETININSLSQATKPPVQRGEVIQVKLIKEGEEQGQGIGFLDDGTMVVVEMGKSHVGQEVDLYVTGVLQTHAGRMVFGKIHDGNEPKDPQPKKKLAHSKSTKS